MWKVQLTEVTRIGEGEGFRLFYQEADTKEEAKLFMYDSVIKMLEKGWKIIFHSLDDEGYVLCKSGRITLHYCLLPGVSDEEEK